MKRIVFIMLACILLTGCGTGGEKLSLTAQGDHAFSRRDYTEAVRIWNLQYKKSPDDPFILKKLGAGYLKLGRLERAKVLYESAVKAAPDEIDGIIHLARLYLLTFDFPLAEQLVERSLAKGLSHPELSILKADICLLKQKTDEAETFYRKAVIESKDAIRALLKLAIFLRSEKRETEAVEFFEIILDSRIRNPKIQLLMADFHKLGREFKKAEEAILSAISLEPEQLDLKYHLFLFYLEMDRIDSAEAVLTDILKLQDDIHLKMMLADIRLVQGRTEEAGQIISQIKDQVGEKVAAFELLQGKYWLYAGKPAFATSHFKTAVGLKPGLSNTRYFLGLTHLANSKIKLSENSLLMTLQLDPRHERALLLIAKLYYKKNEYRLSMDYVSKLLEQSPSHFTGMILKGLNYIEMGLLEDAKNTFEQTLFLSAANPVTSQYYLGLVEEKQGNYEKALGYYQKVLQAQPGLLDVSYRYGMMHIRLGNIEETQDFIQSRISQQEVSANFYYMLAKLAGQMDAYEQQERLLLKGIEKNEKLGVIYLELSKYYKKRKRFTRSLEVLEACIEKNPEYENGWIELGAAYLERQRPLKALETLEKGADRFKTSAIYLSNLAWVYLENETQIHKALNLAQAAYDIAPGDTAIVDTLGWAYYHKGVYSQAVWLLTEAAHKEPENPMIRYHLAMTYYRQGRFQQAQDILKQLKSDPALSSYQPLIVQTLQKLGKKIPAGTADPMEELATIISDPEIKEDDSELIIPRWSVE